jgi:amino acid adenylation domain-containing protein
LQFSPAINVALRKKQLVWHWKGFAQHLQSFYCVPNRMNSNIALPFCNNAMRNPERLALSVDGRDFSYGELAESVRRIARWLREGSAGEVKRVGILASKTWIAYAGILGSAWEGAAYIPLNPDWPEQRLQKILEATELDALVVDGRGLKRLSPEILRFCPKQILTPEQAGYIPSKSFPDKIPAAGFDTLPAANSKHFPKPVGDDDLAYIMFTSGTTGIPKGVMVSAGNVRSFLFAIEERFQFSASDRVSQIYEITFDPSVLDMFTTWRSGASLHVIPASQLMGPSRFIREKQLTCYFSVPSMLSAMQTMKMLTPGAFPSIRYSIFCGEPLPASSAAAWQQAAPNSVVENLYGPTEATVVCIGQCCSSPLVVTETRGTIAIGKPFAGTEAAIVDSSLRFLPGGEKGELAVSGGQVAKGYFKDAQKTAARFPTIEGKVWYLTGDLAYQDSASRFHHLGRTDNQVKILGNRVEIEDVEAHLRAVCSVDSVAAVAWPIKDGVARGIVAFIAGTCISAPGVREGMQSRVPRYMVPTQVRFLDKLALNTSGKVDRKALWTLLSESSA